MMFNLYAKFLMGVIVPQEEENQNSVLSSPTSHLLTVYEKAETMGCITEDLACQHISFYLQLGRLDEARKLAEKLCSGKLSDSVQLWLLRVSIEIRSVTKDSPSPSKAALLSIFELLRKVLTNVSISKAESLWLMVRYHLPTYFSLFS
jgi:U3 small nucleolar RNA-associated protein 6